MNKEMTYTGFWASLILSTTYEGKLSSGLSLGIALIFLIMTIIFMNKGSSQK